jgi:hypothetical protein
MKPHTKKAIHAALAGPDIAMLEDRISELAEKFKTEKAAWVQEAKDSWRRGREEGYRAGLEAKCGTLPPLTVPLSPDGSKIEMTFSRRLTSEEWARFLHILELWRVPLTENGTSPPQDEA